MSHSSVRLEGVWAHVFVLVSGLDVVGGAFDEDVIELGRLVDWLLVETMFF